MKIKSIILTIVLIVCVGLLAGTVYLFNDIFPKAEPIRHPEPDEIASVKLSCNTPDTTIPMSEQYYEDLIQYISEAKPTRKHSLNDTPTSGAYYGVEIQTDEKQYRYFIYEEGVQVYIEMPYEGIYEAEDKLFNIVLKYFEES